MATYNVKFIKGYSLWFKLPIEHLVNIVIDNCVSAVQRKFICETRLKGILTYDEIKTSYLRRTWAKNNPKWINLEYYRRLRRAEHYEQKDDQIECDCLEMDFD
jgi:hypothetical protein